MQQALRETANVKTRQGAVVLYLSEQQASLLINSYETHSSGDFNYN